MPIDNNEYSHWHGLGGAFIGAASWAWTQEKDPWQRSLLNTFVGFGFAAFVAPAVCEYFHLESMAAVGVVGYVLGQSGMNLTKLTVKILEIYGPDVLKRIVEKWLGIRSDVIIENRISANETKIGEVIDVAAQAKTESVIAKQVVEVLEAKVNAVAIATGQSKKKANDLETRVAEIADKVGS